MKKIGYLFKIIGVLAGTLFILLLDSHVLSLVIMYSLLRPFLLPIVSIKIYPFIPFTDMVFLYMTIGRFLIHLLRFASVVHPFGEKESDYTMWQRDTVLGFVHCIMVHTWMLIDFFKSFF